MTKDILGFEGLYTISDLGEVYCMGREIKMPNGGIRILNPHIPAFSITRKGYLKVMLTNSAGTRKGYLIHRLVICNFLHQSELQVNHKDLNKKNNILSNLEFATNRENTNHRYTFTEKSSILSGVTWHKGRNKWQAQKMIAGKRTYLGIFDNEKDAHEKYISS